MPLTLRPAGPADIAAVLELWSAGAENRGRPADNRDAVEHLLDRDGTALILAIEAETQPDANPEIVGTIIVGWDGWRCHLYRLAVHPDRRRQGIGRTLVAAAIVRARQLGASRIDAMVLDDNDLGQSIWQATGFTQQADWRRWVQTM